MKKTKFPIKYEVMKPPLSDGRFTPVKILLMHTGLNLNNSYFSKESIIKALPTLANIPILGFIESKKGRDDFAGHEERLLIKDDELKVEYLGSAYGVIPETNHARFEFIDGKEYLVVNGLIFNMFEDARAIIERDEFKSQSMELYEEGIEGEWIDNTFHFTNFSFRGACFLGDNVLPAMEGSKIIKEQIFNYSFSYTEEMVSAIREFNKMFETIIIDNSKDSAIDGDWENPESSLYEPLLEQENPITLLQEAYLIVEENWENSPSTNLKYPHHILSGEKMIVHVQGVKSAFARLAQTEPENKEAFEHLKRHYKELELDMTEIEKYERSKDMDFEKLYNELVEKFNSVNAEFETLKSDFQAKVEELESVVQEKETLFAEKSELESFKAEIVAEQRKTQEEALFSKFQGKIDDAIIAQVKETSSEFSLEEIEVKLFAELGKAMLEAKEVETKEAEEKDSGIVFSKKRTEQSIKDIVEDILR